MTPPGAACVGEAVVALAGRRLVSLLAFRGCDAALGQALGVALPVLARVVDFGGMRYLWAGPGAWLAMADDPARLDALFAIDAMAAVSEQGDGRCLFFVNGPQAREILARLLPIDLSESAFGPDFVAISQAGHVGVMVWREGDGFILACYRSFAGSLHHALNEAARAANFPI
ncbi:MAG: sarcosine oxidase subunit gamma family protein [Acidocella sp.]|nr:sarcosine oxidase subunit gamma family protein [Acidocella sp.]